MESEILANRLRHTFVRYIMDGTSGQSNAAMSAWLEEAVQHVQMRHRKLVHYIPCVPLSIDDRDTYTFGPITFVKKLAFFEDHAAAIATYENAHERLSERTRRNASPSDQHCWNSNVDRKKIGAADAFREFTDGMDWIAIVPVALCERSVSEQRAETALRIAFSADQAPTARKKGGRPPCGGRSPAAHEEV